MDCDECTICDARYYYQKYGKKALLKASYRGIDDICKKLIHNYGCDVNMRDKRGSTPLMCAAANGHYSFCKELIHHGAKVNLVDFEGWSALMFAAAKRHVKICRRLIRHRADVNAQDDDGLSVLMIAAKCGYTEILKDLLKAGAKTDLTERDEGKSALMMAVDGDFVEICSILMDHGANANQKGRYGATPMALALGSVHSGIFGKLLAQGMQLKEDKTQDKKSNKDDAKQKLKKQEKVVQRDDNPHSDSEIHSHDSDG